MKPTTRDRVTEIRIAGLRCIERLRLTLSDVTVLIGDNGSGKSSILEAVEVLRRAAYPAGMSEVNTIHGGRASLLRHGATELRLGLTLEGAGAKLRYEFALRFSGPFAEVYEERLMRVVSPKREDGVFERTAERARVSAHGRELQVPTTQLALSVLRVQEPRDESIVRMANALENLELHVPFEVTANWLAQAHERRSALRIPTPPQPVTRLERLGSNLASVFHHLKNGAPGWDETMDFVRLGLGDHVEEINVPAATAGYVALQMKLRGRDEPVPATALSDGQLAYLAMVALVRLPRPTRPLLAFDEPELHLHPELLSRVVQFFERLGRDQPVLLATHSDRLLDALSDPVKSVRVCDVDENGNGSIRELDAEALKLWLEKYRGVGDIRGSGFLGHVLGKGRA